MQKLSNKAALIIIDVQKGFDHPKWGERNNLHAEQNIERLLQAWRASQRPVFHVQHLSMSPNSPLNPNSSGSEIKDNVKPKGSEPVIQKSVNSAFMGTNLEQLLRDNQIKTLVITGLTTPHCVSTTTRMAGNFGFDTYLVSDATAAFEIVGHNGRRYSAEEIHETALATLHEEFATLVETETVLKNL
jgi:nicotinamidase-related amidase